MVPAAVGLAITPLLMYKLFPPEIKDTPEAPKVGRWEGVGAVGKAVGRWGRAGG